MIAEHPEQFPGIRVQLKTQRVYPWSETLEHVTGARTKSPPEPKTADSNPADSDRRSGRFGIEMSYNEMLSGQPGLRRIVRDRRQRIVSSEIVRRPASGSDVVLSIDIELQMLAEQLLAESLGDAERILLAEYVGATPADLTIRRDGSDIVHRDPPEGRQSAGA